MVWLWPLVAIAGFAVMWWALNLRARPKVYRTLASRQPERRTREVPLGMEGLDLDEISRTNRRNESLERGQTNWLSKSGFFGRPDTDIRPLADDETYAARYHSAFQKDKTKD